MLTRILQGINTCSKTEFLCSFSSLEMKWNTRQTSVEEKICTKETTVIRMFSEKKTFHHN